MSEIRKKKKIRLSTFQIIILGFAGVILFGALILMLPISSKNGVITSFNEALFTATSAVCVTGLVVQDTGSYWSVFGQTIILLLIQVGGLGVVTVAASLAMFSGRKISLMQRSTMQEAMSAPKVGGIVKLTGFIIKGTFLIETVGALLMMPVFCKQFRLKGIWYAFFHSISAFCNAGFDIMGTDEAPFQSLTSYANNPIINIVVIFLIVLGGLGFLTWRDILTNKHHIKKYTMQSKVILITSLILIFIPAVFFFFVDFNEFSLGSRMLLSIFQSVTTRTAGFNTAELSAMTGAGQMIMIILMLVGGSPGSTAGGMKTTTLAVLLSNAVSRFRRKEDVNFFGRRIDADTVKNASTIIVMYFVLFFTSAILISVVEELPMDVCMFETASALGTAGLTQGITTSVGTLSQIILIILMFLGRVGGLTLIYAALSGGSKNLSKLPLEKITVG